MKGFLSQRQVAYTVRDVATDATAMAELERLGYMTTPVTVIDGEVVVGFDPKKLDAALSDPSSTETLSTAGDGTTGRISGA